MDDKLKELRQMERKLEAVRKRNPRLEEPSLIDRFVDSSQNIVEKNPLLKSPAEPVATEDELLEIRLLLESTRG